MESRNVRYLPAVDHLRLLAALMVLAYHGGLAIAPNPTWPHPRHWAGLLVTEGYSGVTLFMVISGFILTYGALGRQISYGSFLRNRALRLLPLLIVAFALTVSISSSAVSPLLVLNGFVPTGTAGPQGMFAVTWSVFVEIELYLLFPVLLRLLDEGGPRRMLSVLALFAGLRFLALSNGADQLQVLYRSVFGRADQFVLGMIAAWFLRRYPSRWWALLAPVGGAGVILVLGGFNQHGGVFASGASALGSRWAVLSPTAEGLAWACLLLGYVAVVRVEMSIIGRGLAALGATTYSVYLLHMAVLAMLIHYQVMLDFGSTPYTQGVATTLLVAIPVTLVLARLSYRTIELPFLRMRKRYVSDPVQRPVVVEATVGVPLAS